uniref:Uncharacterized protein n=1 Tax=Denticeps clupeoides TaxID=299321 RepID=A0AAY3ZW84_9TELE
FLSLSAWIRGRRKQPPTEQEILNNVQYREQIKVKALEVEDKDRALQGKEYEDGLVARPALAHVRGHAAATQFGRPETSEDPVSAGNTFQPGTWAPPGEKK